MTLTLRNDCSRGPGSLTPVLYCYNVLHCIYVVIKIILIPMCCNQYRSRIYVAERGVCLGFTLFAYCEKKKILNVEQCRCGADYSECGV